MKINPPCTYTVERAAARWNNGRRSPDARCFDRPHSSFLLCINYVVCTVCVCVGEKMNGKCNFQEGFYSICPTLSINVRQLHDRFHDSCMTTAAAFPAAVVAVWQKNSPLLYCLDVLRDQQKNWFTLFTTKCSNKWKVLEVSPWYLCVS